jgi:putative methyltransferase (TIGR04325 family)
MGPLERILPPFIYDLIYHSAFRRYGWFGNYATWEKAKNASEGYDTSVIVDKVQAATMKVKEGIAAYERDSVVFDKIEYNWPVLSGLLWLAAQAHGNLNVVDFGGSLGTTYWQNRKFLTSIPSLRWNIIEQPAFVECGKRLIEDEVIKFFYDLPSCLVGNKPQVVLLSSILSYLERPYDLLSDLKDRRIEFLIIDRLPTVKGDHDRLTVQKVPPYIYKASYPAWFFSYSKFMDFLTQYFKIIEEYDCPIKANIPSVFKGFILKIL